MLNEIFARGRDAMQKAVHVNIGRRFLGWEELSVCTREDFIANAEAILDYVGKQKSVLILGPSNQVTTLMCRHTIEIQDP